MDSNHVLGIWAPNATIAPPPQNIKAVYLGIEPNSLPWQGSILTDERIDHVREFIFIFNKVVSYYSLHSLERPNTSYWKWELNPHEHFCSMDFKSIMPTNSIIPACVLIIGLEPIRISLFKNFWGFRVYHFTILAFCLDREIRTPNVVSPKHGCYQLHHIQI